jgi:hypothetical protein
MMRQMFSIKPMKKALHPFLLLALACAIGWHSLTLNPQTRVTSPNLLPGQSSTILPAGSSLLLGGETNGGVSPAATIWDPRTGDKQGIAVEAWLCAGVAHRDRREGAPHPLWPATG